MILFTSLALLVVAPLACLAAQQPPVCTVCQCTPTPTLTVDCARHFLRQLPDFSAVAHVVATLDLSDNFLTCSSLEQASLLPFSSLTTLNLFFNPLECFPSNFISNAPNLTTLTLTASRVRNVPANAFAHNPKLQFLSLGANLIRAQYFSPNAFNNTRLSTLLLNDNPLASFPSVLSTRHAASITRLDLSFTRLHTLGETSLSTLSNLTTLSLAFNELTGATNGSLAPGAFQNATQLVSLDLSGNPLGRLPSSLATTSFPLMRALNISNTNLRSLNANFSFHHMPQLSSLDLSGNQLFELPQNLFDGVASLQHLSLARNPLGVVPNALRDSQLASLSHLDLGYAGLSNGGISSESFASLSSLSYLSLQGNVLEGLPPGVLNGTRHHNLTTLIFSGNVLTSTLDLNLPLLLPSLSLLALSETNLRNVTARAFAMLPALTLLALSDNQLSSSSIDPLAFDGLPHLHTLYLNGNPLRSFPTQIQSLSSLTILSLASAQIFAFPSSAFAAMPFLQQLSLSNNFKASHGALLQEALLPSTLFESNSRLSHLYLDGNPLGTFPKAVSHASLPVLSTLVLNSTLLHYLGQSPFANLTSLQHLNLASNQLSSESLGSSTLQPLADTLVWLSLESNPLGRFPAGLLNSTFGQLSTLDLRNAGLLELPAHIIAAMASLRLLDLSSNQLNENSVDPDAFASNTSRPTTLVLDNNPFLNFPRALQLTTTSLEYIEHISLRNCRLSRIPTDAFAAMPSLLEVNLHSNNLSCSSIPPFLFGSRHRSISLLDLEGNPLGCFPEFLLQSRLVTLQVLLLAGTQISVLPPSTLQNLPNLILLDLRFNELEEPTLPPDLFNQSIALTELQLDSNPLQAYPSALRASSLSELRVLSLSDTEIPSLPADAFTSLVNIRSIDLSRNNIVKLDDNLFPKDILNGLMNLNLNENPLMEFPVALRSLYSLETLSLSFCNISKLVPADFASMYALHQLVLDANPVGDSISAIATTLVNLLDLSLNETGLATLPVGLFQSMRSLERLSLVDNYISDLPPDTFNGLRSLRVLRIDRNLLSEYPLEALRQLTALETLSISGMQLTSVPAEAFQGIHSLRNVVLSNNWLTELPCGIFSGVFVTGVYLTNNNLTSLDECWLNDLYSFTSFSLAGNKLRTVKAGVFSRWYLLSSLSFESNLLEKVPFGLPSNIEMLFLDENRLSVLNPAAIVSLPVLSVLSISHNPLLVLDSLSSLFTYFPPSQLRRLTISAANCSLNGSLTIPPIAAINLASNDLESVVTTPLTYTRGWGIATIFYNKFYSDNGSNGPSCPPNMYGTQPVCEGFCSTECSFQGFAGCYGPSPRDCCPNGWTGPNCQYVFLCEGLDTASRDVSDLPCSGHGTCHLKNPETASFAYDMDASDTVYYSFDVTCRCDSPYLSYQPSASSTSATSNVPKCLRACNETSMYPLGSSCYDCDPSCTAGCDGPLNTNCKSEERNTDDRWAPIVGSIAGLLLIALVALVVYRRHAEKRRVIDINQMGENNRRHIEEIRHRWLIGEKDLAFREGEAGVVGVGGGGKVLEATWCHVRKVAVKELQAKASTWRDNTATATDYFAVERKALLDEMNLLQLLRHPNVIELYGYGKHSANNSPFYVMPLCKGSLVDVVSRRLRVTREVRQDLLRQVARGMEYVHNAVIPRAQPDGRLQNFRVIHRDLKLDNVLVALEHIDDSTTRLVAKVCDFGECKLVEYHGAVFEGNAEESQQSDEDDNEDVNVHGDNGDDNINGDDCDYDAADRLSDTDGDLRSDRGSVSTDDAESNVYRSRSLYQSESGSIPVPRLSLPSVEQHVSRSRSLGRSVLSFWSTKSSDLTEPLMEQGDDSVFDEGGGSFRRHVRSTAQRRPAKIPRNYVKLSKNDEIFGTAIYKAPELLKPRARFYGQPIDVYAFAIIMWEVIMQQRYQVEDENYNRVKSSSNPLRPSTQCDLFHTKARNWPIPLLDLMQAMWQPNQLTRPSFCHILYMFDQQAEAAGSRISIGEMKDLV